MLSQVSVESQVVAMTVTHGDGLSVSDTIAFVSGVTDQVYLPLVLR